jgi:threonine dehydrogenase-like Zn-dependent dehydrogenase
MQTETSAVVIAPEKMEMQEFPIPSIGPEEMLLRVEMVSICGSDPHHYSGGKYNVFPKILGHEMVGFVEELGEKAAQDYGVTVGERVVVEPYIPCWRCRYCATGYYQLCPQRRIYGVNMSCEDPPHLWGAYGEYMYVAPASRVHKISRDVSPQAATLTSVIGNGVRWVVTKGKLRVGEAVAIVGPGALGLASTIVAHHAGADIIIVLGLRADERRLKFAQACGATHILINEGQDVAAQVQEICQGELPSLVVEASGSPDGIITALSLVRPAGTCVISGNTGTLTPINTDAIVRNEIQILGGLGQSRDVEAAIKIIESGRYPIDQMVGSVYPLREAEQAIRHFIDHPQDSIRIGLRT